MRWTRRGGNEKEKKKKIVKIKKKNSKKNSYRILWKIETWKDKETTAWFEPVKSSMQTNVLCTETISASLKDDYSERCYTENID